MRLLLLYLFASAVLGACADSEQIEDAPCPTEGTSLRYDSFAEDFFDAYCQPCHKSTAQNRQGAPVDFAFDTVDDIREHKERIFARAASDNVSMPPGPNDPTTAEREDLAEWLRCGAP